MGWLYFTKGFFGSQCFSKDFFGFCILHKICEVFLVKLHKSPLADVERIKLLAKEQGKSLKYLCDRLGKRGSFISEVKLGKDKIDQNELEILANELNTTIEYLTDQTDQKEKPTDQMTDGQIDKELLSAFGSLNEDDRRQVMAFIAGLKARR